MSFGWTIPEGYPDENDENTTPQYQNTAAAVNQADQMDTDNTDQPNTTNAFWQVVDNPATTDGGNPSSRSQGNINNRSLLLTSSNEQTVGVRSTSTYNSYANPYATNNPATQWTSQNAYEGQGAHHPDHDTSGEPQVEDAQHNVRTQLERTLQHSSRRMHWKDEERQYLAQLLDEDRHGKKAWGQIADEFNAQYEGRVIGYTTRPRRGVWALREQRNHPLVRPAYERWRTRNWPNEDEHGD